MDSSFDLPDSTDWLSTSLPAFEPLEAALRCEVCKEFYTNPVITSCAHTFCSICIRRCIATDGKCPSCKTSCSSDKLIPNIVVREVVIRFQEARPKALKLARADKEESLENGSGRKRKLDETDIEEDKTVQQTRPRRTRIPRNQDAGMKDSPIEIPNSDDDGDEEFLPEGMAKCPICNKQMKAEQVYNHLDVCPGQNASQERSTRSKAKSAFPAALSKRPKEASPPPARLSQLNYAMLKETALRKKLQEIGIPGWGSKDLLKRRHIEWLNIYNANCDADDSLRKSKQQLLKELDEWEQTQGGRANNKESKVMRKDFDGDSHARSHKSNFDNLIAQARKVRTTPKTNEGEDADRANTEVESSDVESRGSMQSHELLQGSSDNTMVGTESSSYREQVPNQQPLDSTSKLSRCPDPPHNNDFGRIHIFQPDPDAVAQAGANSIEELTSRGSTNSEGDFNPFASGENGIRKLPVFTVSEDPIRDVESSTVVQ